MKARNTARVRAHLQGFWQRQQARTAKRQTYYRQYYAGDLPVHSQRKAERQKRPKLDPARDIYGGTPHTRTVIRRVRRRSVQ